MRGRKSKLVEDFNGASLTLLTTTYGDMKSGEGLPYVVASHEKVDGRSIFSHLRSFTIDYHIFTQDLPEFRN